MGALSSSREDMSGLASGNNKGKKFGGGSFNSGKGNKHNKGSVPSNPYLSSGK